MTHICKACKERPQDWKGDPLKCAFQEKIFSSQNWNCAGANAIRDIAESDKSGVIRYYTGEHQNYCAIDVSEVVEFFPMSPSPNCLYVGWYKSRGRTECMWLMFDEATPRAPTEKEVELIVEHYKNR